MVGRWGLWLGMLQGKVGPMSGNHCNKTHQHDIITINNTAFKYCDVDHLCDKIRDDQCQNTILT